MRRTLVGLPSALVALVASGAATAKAPQLPPGLQACPTPDCRVIDHGERHTGVDVRFAVGEQVTRNYPAEVIALVRDPLTGDHWGGAVFRLAPPSESFVFRFVGIAVPHAVGTKLEAGAAVGIVQDPKALWPRVLPHVHVEVYLAGVLANPEPYAETLWPGRSIEDPGIEYFRAEDSPAQVAEARAWAAFDAGRFAEAIPLFETARVLIGWETGWQDIIPAHAHSYARTGDFARAVALQERYVAVMELLRDYASHRLPDPELGVIAAVSNVQSVTIRLARGRDNLQAYRNRDPGPGL
ncbi:MAG: hypothetical protein FJX64_06910 [Alphaproteobacteria bacterium]|nr:hypothetical protein [Alphaproteobacteria bacterium]